MPGKLLPQTPLEMMESEQARRAGSKLYKQASAEFVDQQITDMVTETAQELERAAKAEPVSLTDTDRVIEITLDYVRACAQASTVPSIVGLSRSLGMTRAAIYDVITRGSQKATARWLEIVKDSFSEMLGNSALRNGTNTITSIFLLKALYDYRESNEIIVKSEQGQTLTDEDRAEMARQLAERYQDLPED